LTAVDSLREERGWAYTRALYRVPGVAETVRVGHIESHYCVVHRALNPLG